MSYQEWATPVDPRESPTLTMDLTKIIADQGGGNIASVVIDSAVYSGPDPNPQAIIGASAISGGKVSFRLVPGATAYSYLITAEATLASGALVVASAVLRIQKGGA